VSSIPAFLRKRAEPWLDRPALRYSDGKDRIDISYRDFFDRVDRFAQGLVALGVQPGDKVFLLADNSPRWLIADLGILRAGAICVPRGADTTPAEAEYILSHSGATVIVAANPRLLDHIPDGNYPIKAYISLAGGRESVVSFDKLLEMGKGEPLPLAGGDVATIVYTSGTTGAPKGVMLTHDNILSQVKLLPPLIGVEPTDRCLSVLPSWHMFERTVEYIVIASGACLSYSSLRTLKADLQTEKPTLLPAVPRLYEGVQAGFYTKLEQRTGFAKKFAMFMLNSSLKWTKLRRYASGMLVDPRGQVTGSRTAAKFRALLAAPMGMLGRHLVGKKVREAVGGRLRIAISGGGMLPLHLDTFFDALGLGVYVGYGLTETSPVVTLRTPAVNVLGSIGRAVPETELRVTGPSGETLPNGETGELECRGPQVMPGYYNDEGATKGVIREDGWFRTGDLVQLTDNGDVLFTGRLKETIVLAGGENIEPNPIESRILESPCIRQVMVIGQDRKMLGALIVPDPERAEADAAARNQSVEELIRSEVDRLVTKEAGFKTRERIAKIIVLSEEFTVEDGCLTRTLKLRRNEILAKYGGEIEELFG
jgi:long-chain acyl-CoA synthetase